MKPLNAEGNNLTRGLLVLGQSRLAEEEQGQE